MRTQFLDDLGDTLFAVAMAGAIGLGAANLAIQVNKERAAFDSAAASQKVGRVVTPPPVTTSTGIRTDESASQLNY